MQSRSTRVWFTGIAGMAFASAIAWGSAEASQSPLFLYDPASDSCVDAADPKKSGYNKDYLGECGWFNEADFSGKNLRGMNLRGISTYKTNLSGADLRDADLTGARIQYSDLTGADLRKARAVGAAFTNTKVNGADFTGADLRKGELGHVKFLGAKLQGAQLQGAKFALADVSGTDLTGVSFEGADASFMLFDATTRFPKVDLKGDVDRNFRAFMNKSRSTLFILSTYVNSGRSMSKRAAEFPKWELRVCIGLGQSLSTANTLAREAFVQAIEGKITPEAALQAYILGWRWLKTKGFCDSIGGEVLKSHPGPTDPLQVGDLDGLVVEINAIENEINQILK